MGRGIGMPEDRQAGGFVRILLDMSTTSSNIIPQAHPNLDKKLFQTSQTLGLKQADKAFPPNQELKILQWRSDTADQQLLPMSVSCWPSNNGSKGMSCIVEYEVKGQQADLFNLEITIPTPSNDVKVDNVDVGDYTFKKGHHLTWNIERVDSKHKTGQIEFLCSGNKLDENSFFPVTIKFQSPKTFSGISVKEIQSTESGGGGSSDTVRFGSDLQVRGAIILK